jgi:hypothetical protein
MIIRAIGRLHLLAVVLLVCGLAAAFVARIDVSSPSGLSSLLPLVPLFALVMCQVCLLGLWVVFSKTPWWKRVGGFAFGALYFEHLWPGLSFPRGEFFLLPSMAMAFLGCALLIMRGMGYRLCVGTVSDSSSRSEHERFRFSIRGLMLMTVAIALFVAGTKELKHFAPRGEFVIRWAEWDLCVVAVGISAFWAALGLARPRQRSAVTVALSAVLGTPFALAESGPGDRDRFYNIITIMPLHAALLLASLLVVRSCGYRLMWRPRSAIAAPIVGVPVIEDAQSNDPLTLAADER